MKLTTALALALAFAAPVIADVVPFDEGGLNIEVPTGWKSSKSGGAFVIDAPADMSIVFLPLPDKDQAKAVAAVEKALDDKVGKVTWEDKPEKEKINDMDAEIWEGTAKEGKRQIEATYLEVGDKTVAVYWFDTKETEEKYKKEIEQIVKGTKKK